MPKNSTQIVHSFSALSEAKNQLDLLELQLLKRRLKTTESASKVRPVIQGRELKAFCSNDYLGLANHPLIIDALIRGAQQYGAGSGASHLISGHSEIHAALEQFLAHTQKLSIPNARALFFSTGYLANLCAITGFARLGKLKEGSGRINIYSAKLNHASLIDGVKLAAAQTGAQIFLFDHRNLNELESQLNQEKKRFSDAHQLIVIDGVFSMDGDIAPITKLVELANQFDALLMVDDAHGFGVLGKHGSGLLELEKIQSERIVYIGTLSKAAGISGAFVCADAHLIEWLVQKGRPYIYSTATPPAIANALMQSVEIIQGKEGQARRAHLGELIHLWKSEVRFKKWQLSESNTPIQVLILGSNEDALEASRRLDQAGFWIPAIRPPTVPKDSARLRITFSAEHSKEDVLELVKALHLIEEGIILK
ncbi:MAG: 8-amino-7-oxononanoate synthase [Polynucleobacter sp.]|jgi:8-amino-7-oxononanoate synthase|nr:8-amino-7-oxononanoate synthase [Polynucleobacter sp.]